MLIRKESPAAFFQRAVVRHYMAFGERGSSFNLCVRGIFFEVYTNRLRDKRPLVDYFMTSGGYENSNVRFLEVSFIRTVLIAGRYTSELIST
jgi:hypothetical protein